LRPYDDDPSDLDNGRLIYLIGVAVLTLAEFLTYGIGQKAAEAI